MIKPISKFKSEKVENIKKRFKNEWLLIRVDEVENSSPVRGRLIEHSPDRDVIYKKIAKANKKYTVFVTYSTDKLPKGYIAAFSTHA